jgi:hypothetical protein
MRFILACLATLLLLMPVARAAHAQDRDVRFAITAVGDTTVTFRAGKMTWVVRSPRAIVVDPRRRDELVARIKVLSVSSTGDATAVVTGQTGRITVDHFVVAREPPSRWYRNAYLWMGAALGLVTGFGLGKI